MEREREQATGACGRPCGRRHRIEEAREKNE